MANIRIKDQTTVTTLQAGDYVIVDTEESGVGTRKFDLGSALSGGSGSGLTDTEKSLILTLFNQAAYAENEAGTAYNQLSNLWSGYSITWSGSGFTHSNNSSSITGGSTYTSTVSASSGFTITGVVATMGGNTVQGAWQNGTVTIPNVTGNIVITVTTVQATVSSISALYTQSGTVYDTDSLDSLKSDLVVTATYVDQSTYTVPSAEYTLSGTLTEGTSTITVSYEGKTTTFTVVVTHTITSEVLDTFTKNTMFSQTDLSNVSASNDHLVVSTIKASQVSFTWNTTEAPVFSITIGQYDSSGTPSKLLNHQAYSSAPVTDGSGFDSASWWTNPGTYKWCAIGGGNMTINLPSDGTVKIGLRYGTSGTVVTSNATFWTWLENGGLTITAHI